MSSSTASRPRTSSTCTSRSWPERLKSPAISSWTPGKVFTGTPASRHALTIRWRTSPSPDGMAMMTSSGRLSARSRAAPRRAQHTDPVEPHVLLAGVVVDEPDRRVAELPALEHLADDELARVAGADDQRLLAARDEAAPPGPLSASAREPAPDTKAR